MDLHSMSKAFYDIEQQKVYQISESGWKTLKNKVHLLVTTNKALERQVQELTDENDKLRSMIKNEEE